jgi:replication factor C small subunit
MKQLWAEKYRPQKLNDYVFRDGSQKKQVETWLKSETIPHLLFSGGPGTGKTTLAKVLLFELDVDWGDVLFINGSTDNGVDYIRDIITNFASTMPFGEFKYIILDEADYLTANAQAALRGVMERYSNICRFILTCNYPHKIIPALHSRCQGFHIEKLDRESFLARMVTILATEGVLESGDDEDILDILDLYVEATYPDMRKCINLCQQNTDGGKLNAPHTEEMGVSDYKLQMIALFRQNKIKEARKVICENAAAEDYEDIYRHLYQNLDYWGATEGAQMKAILIIRNALVNHVAIADPEINLSACLIELEMIDEE